MKNPATGVHDTDIDKGGDECTDRAADERDAFFTELFLQARHSDNKHFLVLRELHDGRDIYSCSIS